MLITSNDTPSSGVTLYEVISGESRAVMIKLDLLRATKAEIRAAYRAARESVA